MTWAPIATAPHDEGLRVQLWAEHARVCEWEWSEDHQRWERESGIHWAEGEDGPTHWCPMAEPPTAEQVAEFAPMSRYALAAE